VPDRASLEKIYKVIVDEGVIDAPEIEATIVQEKFLKLEGVGKPQCGWIELTRELRLAGLAVGPLESEMKTKKAIEDAVSAIATSLAEGSRQLNAITEEWHFISAAISAIDIYEFHDQMEALQELTGNVERIQSKLIEISVPRKELDARKRHQRVKLAVLLAPIFEEQFGEPAKPKRDDKLKDVERGNDWMRFYHTSVYLIWDKGGTPNMLDILWEAWRPPLTSSDIERAIFDEHLTDKKIGGDT